MHIATQRETFEDAELPIMSIDTKRPVVILLHDAEKHLLAL
jgi:hypothetical protein